MSRPVERLRALLARHCSEKAMWQNIDPVVADVQTEYEAARREGRAWASRWIRLCGYAAIVRVLLASEWPSVDRRLLIRTLVLSVFTTVVGLALVLVPEYQRYREVAGLELIPYLVPFALTMTMPAGLLVGAIMAARDGRHSWRTIAGVLTMAVACSMVMFVNLAWVTPASNQTFRTTMFVRAGGEGAPAKGTNELTLGELGARPDGLPYHQRWAMALSPLPLALFALSVRARRGARLLIVPLAALVLFMVCLDAGPRLSRGGVLPPVVGAWLANMLFAIAAVRNLSRSRPLA